MHKIKFLTFIIYRQKLNISLDGIMLGIVIVSFFGHLIVTFGLFHAVESWECSSSTAVLVTQCYRLIKFAVASA